MASGSGFENGPGVRPADSPQPDPGPEVVLGLVAAPGPAFDFGPPARWHRLG